MTSAHSVAIDIDGGNHTSEPIVFDASTAATEVWLVGAGDGAEIRPSDRDPSATLFTIRDGAPPIYFQALTLLGSIRSEGGRFHATRCIFGPARDDSHRLRRLQGLDGLQPSQRALTVAGGVVVIEEATFFNLTGGAIAVEAGGTLQISNSRLSSNRADIGGAMIIRGGRAVVARCLIERNYAVVAGGGLHVTGGVLELTNQTVLRGNEASEASSISVAPGTPSYVTYALPAPLAHYVFVVGGTSFAVLTSSINVDFPFPCPGGVVGNSYAALAQSGPWCSDVCPAGFACRAGTEVPEICPPG